MLPNPSRGHVPGIPQAPATLPTASNTLRRLPPRTAVTLTGKTNLVVSLSGCTTLNCTSGEMTIAAGTFIVLHGRREALVCTESGSTALVLELPGGFNWKPLRGPLPEGTGQLPDGGRGIAARLSGHSPPGRDEIASVIGDVLAAWEPLIARCPGRLLSRKLAVFERLQRARLFMLSNVSRKLRICEIAEHVSYTVCHFTKVYSATFGRCPKNDLHFMRFEQADHLLGTTDLAVSDVALAAGFSDPSVFARFFKRHHGMSASEYRKAIRIASRTAANDDRRQAPSERTGSADASIGREKKVG